MGKRTWMMFSVVWIVPVLSGCSTAMMDSFFAVSVEEAKDLHNLTRKMVDEHDKKMSAEHTKMHPEAADAISILRQEYETKVAAIQKQADDIHSKVGENVKMLVAMGLKLATVLGGIPAGGSVGSLVASAVDEESEKTSSDGLLRMLMAVGVGTAGGGWLGNAGKGRSKGEIALLKGMINDIKDKMA